MASNVAEAFIWKKERRKLRCLVCARQCLLKEGEAGYCGVRFAKKARIYASNYGNILAAIDMGIEELNIYHFYPGSKALLLLSHGCNIKFKLFPIFNLPDLDYCNPDAKAKNYEAKEIVKMAQRKKAKVIAYGFPDAFMFAEFMFKTMKEAKHVNIKNVAITNGYLTKEAIKKASKYLDAVFFFVYASASKEFYENHLGIDVNVVLDAIKQFKKQRIHIEIGNLIIPEHGDKVEQARKFAQWINAELGATIPLHILQFQPVFEFSDLVPTPIEKLEDVADVSVRSGLRFVYLGNVYEHFYLNTYCYNCREKIIERKYNKVKLLKIVKGRCGNCGVNLNVVMD